MCAITALSRCVKAVAKDVHPLIHCVVGSALEVGTLSVSGQSLPPFLFFEVFI